MSQLESPSMLKPDRRQQILDLAKNLFDDLETVDLTEIDGEFYWRICRDDLLGPLSHLAESIAPHIVDPARRNEQFDEAQQQKINKFRQAFVDSDDDGRERILDWFKKELKARELFTAGQPFAEQLPGFVWQHYSTGQRIPMRAPTSIIATQQGRALEIRISSSDVTGDKLEALVWAHPPEDYFVPEPPLLSAQNDDSATQELEPESTLPGVASDRL